jgi:hypothetical protein
MHGDVKQICSIDLGKEGAMGFVSAKNNGLLQIHQVNWN